VTDGRGVLLEDETRDKPYGWVFFYQSKAYSETGDTTEMLVGSAPVIFNRISGEYRITGTAHPVEHYRREFEATLLPAALQMNPQLRNRSTP
jgi:hypothetical protein